MPFTPVHTLAAVPLSRFWSRPGSFSALVIGSMVPDWPLFVPVGPQYATTHSVSGLFTACLPLGLGIAFFYQAALKQALYELLPEPLRARLACYLAAPVIRRADTLAVLAVAVLLGSASHIVWDAFTHRGAWGVALVPSLADVWVRAGTLHVAGYAVLQLGFSLLGLPLLFLLVARWYRRADPVAVAPSSLARPLRVSWVLLLLAAPAALLGDMLIEAFRVVSPQELRVVLYLGVTRAGFALLLLLVAYALYFAVAGKLRTAAVSASR